MDVKEEIVEKKSVKKSTTKKSEKNQVVEKKKPRGKNIAEIRNGNLEPGDNQLAIRISMDLMSLPEIDMYDPEQVEQRLQDYFEIYFNYDAKPTVAGMAMALNNMTRSYLWSITHDKPIGGMGNYSPLPKEITDIVKKAYKIMEILWEHNSQNGKINPVMAIYLGKNNFGYQDKVEYVITPNNDSNDYSSEDIRKRYIVNNSDLIDFNDSSNS